MQNVPHAIMLNHYEAQSKETRYVSAKVAGGHRLNDSKKAMVWPIHV